MDPMGMGFHPLPKLMFSLQLSPLKTFHQTWDTGHPCNPFEALVQATLLAELGPSCDIYGVKIGALRSPQVTHKQK